MCVSLIIVKLKRLFSIDFDGNKCVFHKFFLANFNWLLTFGLVISDIIRNMLVK